MYGVYLAHNGGSWGCEAKYCRRESKLRVIYDGEGRTRQGGETGMKDGRPKHVG